MSKIDRESPNIEGRDAPERTSRLLAALAATTLAACVGGGAAKSYDVYQDIQDAHYQIDLDTIVGGSPR